MRTRAESPAGPFEATSSGTLLDALHDPSVLASLHESAWDRLLRVYRRNKLLPALAAAVEEAGLTAGIPEKAQEHLLAARREAEQHARMIRWEVNRIRRALRDVGVEIVLLKGAAYVLAGLPPGRGRLVQDLDVLVPKERLPEVERALLAAGWEWADDDSYDQHYYRAWMHELPPLRHHLRDTVLDVHHTILPETGRLRPDPRKLFGEARAIEEAGFKVLAPVDMVLHAAAHMLGDETLGGALRDLIDLDALLRHFAATEPGFWERLAPRARELDLARPLFYALRSCRRLLGAEIPAAVDSALDEVGKPPWPVAGVMDALVNRCLLARTSERGGPDLTVAGWILYVRAHWLRMPTRLLVPHLIRKALRRVLREEDEPPR